MHHASLSEYILSWTRHENGYQYLSGQLDSNMGTHCWEVAGCGLEFHCYPWLWPPNFCTTKISSQKQFVGIQPWCVWRQRANSDHPSFAEWSRVRWLGLRLLARACQKHAHLHTKCSAWSIRWKVEVPIAQWQCFLVDGARSTCAGLDRQPPHFLEIRHKSAW